MAAAARALRLQAERQHAEARLAAAREASAVGEEARRAGDEHFKLFWHYKSLNALPRSRNGYPGYPLTPGGSDWAVERPVGIIEGA